MAKMMEQLKNKFWTSEEEMVKEIENEYFYDVIAIDYETIELMAQDGWDDETEVYELIRANNTIAIKF